MSDFLISVNMNKNMDFALKDLKMIHEGKKLLEIKDDITKNSIGEVKPFQTKKSKKQNDDYGYGR